MPKHKDPTLASRGIQALQGGGEEVWRHNLSGSGSTSFIQNVATASRNGSKGCAAVIILAAPPVISLDMVVTSFSGAWRGPLGGMSTHRVPGDVRPLSP